MHLDFESRIGHNGEQIGEYAERFFAKVLARRDIIFYSDTVLKELYRHYGRSYEERLHIYFVLGILRKIPISSSQDKEAHLVSMNENIPFADATHAILASDNDATLITRDKHFKGLGVVIRKPEDI